MKTCTKCKEEKSLDSFNKRSQTKCGLKYRCRTCEHPNLLKPKIPSKWTEEYTIEYKKQYRKKYRELNREKLRETDRLYQLKNKEKIKEYDKLNRARISKNYLINHRAQIYANNAKRRAIKYQATPKWLNRQHLREISELYKESVRLTKETGIIHHVDHIIPLRGKNVRGLHVPWNLQILTATENHKKTNKLI